MRVFSAFVICTTLFFASNAWASSRVFIVANPANESGARQCLASGDKCGAKAALSYCQSRDYAHVRSYRRVDPDEVTGSVPVADMKNCRNGQCNEIVAIICQR